MKKTAFLWAIFLLSPLPFFYSLFHFFCCFQHLHTVEAEVERLHAKAEQIQRGQDRQSSILDALKNGDLHYLDKHVESLTFLITEIKKLEAIYAENREDENLFQRLQFLKGERNRLRFSEEAIRSQDFFREVEEKQQHPVEMNEEDLKKLLCLIEGVTIWPYGPKEGRPQLIIRDFKLSKKELPSQEKVYEVSMQLLKREQVE